MSVAAVAMAVSLWLTATGIESGAEPPQFDFHGFVSQGGIKSTENNYLARSKRGSVEFTEVALNLRVALPDGLSVGAQLFTRDLGPIGNYNAKFDWFYLDWHSHDWLRLRAGRVRMPFGLYNDSSDYDPGRVVILLPQSMYPITSRDFLLGLTGAEAYGVFDLDALGLVNYAAYYGTLFFDPSESAQPASVNVPYTTGGQLRWETPLSGLSLGGSVSALRLNGSIFVGSRVAFKVPAVLWAGSAEYVIDRLRVAAEYGRWRVEVNSSNETLVPCGPNAEPDSGPGCVATSSSERYYFLAAIELTDWLQAAAYYSGYFSDVEHREGREHYAHDMAGALRFDISANWLVKLEGHFMHGTAALSSALNGKPPNVADADFLATLPRDWGLVLVKTTAYF